MRELYNTFSANYPRLKKDRLFADYDNVYSYNNFIDKFFKYIESFQLTDEKLWRRFVQQFREDSDYEAGWRGEFWGKMMRGASLVYSYSKNPELYRILTQTVKDMMESADETGRISSYASNHEFDGWDMWSRKYVLLGMQYYLEICTDDELKDKIVSSMCCQLDYIISKIGDEEGKKPITSATRHWRGLNSSSILEPVVRLYNLTGKPEYLDFAKYIVDVGGTDVVNIFKLAYANDLLPYQYPITKAYEMTSCFEGLLEYYRITGEEWYKTALVNYANRILESDFTVIGCSGCTHELFDHSSARQANTTNGNIMQETCVTVTLMKFFFQMHLLTGDTRYVDAFEKSFYNAYLGSINTEKVIEPMIRRDHPDWAIEALPFDSYSPLTAGTRGNGIGGLKIMSDNHYYGCCACIGSAGIGLVPKMHLLTSEKGFALNLFVNGSVKSKTPLGRDVTFNITTEYPVDGKVKVELDIDLKEEFEILIRNPHWSINTQALVKGVNVPVSEGYIRLCRMWQKGDIIEVSFDMRTEAIYPVSYGTDILMNEVIWGHNYMIQNFDREDPIAKNHIALRRGPLMLAQENRLGYSVDDAIEVMVNDDGFVDVIPLKEHTAPYDCILEAKLPLKDGKYITVTDYASAGKLWTEESKMAVWMLTK